MANAVMMALAEDADADWTVTFIGGESRSGKIEPLTGECYKLMRSSSKKEYYFDADKVLFVKKS